MWHAIHTSETGRLENLDQLTPFGKELLYTFVHLLLQGYNGQTLTELLKTYQWLENNPNVFDVSQRNVQRILSKYVSNNDCPENNLYENSEFLRCYENTNDDNADDEYEIILVNNNNHEKWKKTFRSLKFIEK